MKCHPEEGLKLLKFLPKIDDGSLNVIAENMAYCHHEKYDGSGYPQGLKEKEIPLCARVMAAADVLDGLISKRLYKDPMSIDKALEIFEESKGSHFEPCIADAVIRCREKIIELDAQFKETEADTSAKELLWWDWAASQWPIFYKQICRYSSKGIMTDCVRNNIVKKDCFVIKDPKRELLLFSVEEFLKSI